MSSDATGKTSQPVWARSEAGCEEAWEGAGGAFLWALSTLAKAVQHFRVIFIREKVQESTLETSQSKLEGGAGG